MITSQAPPGSTPTRASRKLAWSIAGVLAAFLLHATYLNAITDDAFISFRYARHLAGGQGWVWNVGEPPIEGFTNCLWVVLCTAALRLGLDVGRAAQGLGVLAGIGTLVYTFLFARRRLGLDVAHALIPCWVLALNGPFATWAGSAMETSLFGFFVLAATYHFTEPGLPRPILVAGLLMLATLTRPEGFGIFVLLVLALGLGRRVRWPEDPSLGRRSAVLVGTYVVLFAAYFAWRIATFEDLLPNTFHAKVGMSAFLPLRGLLYTGYFVLYFVAPWLPLLLVRGSIAGDDDEGRFARIALIVVVTGYVAYVIAVGGDYMAMSRFFVPILPFLALVAGLLLASVPRGPGGGSARRRLAAGLAGFGFALTLLHSTPWDVRVFDPPLAQQGNYAGVVNERMWVARYTAVGRYFRSVRTSREEVLATKVIGAMGYYADMKVLDMFGLTDRHIARAKPGARPLGLGFPGHERSDLTYVAERRPRYIFLNLYEGPRRVGYPDWNPEANRILRREYAIRNARLEIPGYGEGWLYYLERTDGSGPTARRGDGA